MSLCNAKSPKTQESASQSQYRTIAYPGCCSKRFKFTEEPCGSGGEPECEEYEYDEYQSSLPLSGSLRSPEPHFSRYGGFRLLANGVHFNVSYQRSKPLLAWWHGGADCVALDVQPWCARAQIAVASTKITLINYTYRSTRLLAGRVRVEINK